MGGGGSSEGHGGTFTSCLKIENVPGHLHIQVLASLTGPPPHRRLERAQLSRVSIGSCLNWHWTACVGQAWKGWQPENTK